MHVKHVFIMHRNGTRDKGICLYPRETSDAHVTMSYEVLHRLALAIRFWDCFGARPLPYQTIEFCDGNTTRTVKFAFQEEVVIIDDHRNFIQIFDAEEFVRFVRDFE